MKNEKKTVKKFISDASKNKADTTNYYNFGFKYFGPFLYGYIYWLYCSIKNSAYRKVFFFSRDGYMMERAFRIFDVNNTINSKYVYFSRKSIRQALLYTCVSYEDSLKYLSWERFITFGKLLEYYGFSLDERRKISRKFNINLETDYTYVAIKENKELKTIYNYLKCDIDKKSMQQGKLLKQYILQIEMTGMCAIVDIGWHGSMQFYLEEFIKIHKLKTTIAGFYVGIQPTVSLSGTCDGYLYHPMDLSLRKSVLCFFGGYEKLFQSCEGSTYGYKDDHGYILPSLTDYEYKNDDQYISCIKELQNGAIDFVIEAKEKNLIISNERIWAYPLIRFGKKPSNKDIKLFHFFYNTDGNKVYFVSQKPLYKYKPQELIHALSNSVWKTGFMKSIFKIPFPYYSIYKIIRK